MEFKFSSLGIFCWHNRRGAKVLCYLSKWQKLNDLKTPRKFESFLIFPLVEIASFARHQLLCSMQIPLLDKTKQRIYYGYPLYLIIQCNKYDFHDGKFSDDPIYQAIIIHRNNFNSSIELCSVFQIYELEFGTRALIAAM